MEVLAGVCDVDVIAVGRWGTTRVRLAPGEDRTITVTVPGTAGIDIEASPNPWALPAFLLAFAAGVAAAVSKSIRAGDVAGPPAHTLRRGSFLASKILKSSVFCLPLGRCLQGF